MRIGDSQTELAPRDTSLDGPVASLSLEHRAVVVCRIYLDLSVAQTATALGVKPGTVKSRLARALDQLRSELVNEPQGDDNAD